MINIFPTYISFSSNDDPFKIITDGTLGDNGWYTSPINITIIYDPNEIKEIWYNIGDGFQKYQEQFTISKEGPIAMALYYIDSHDIEHGGIIIFFKIDLTPPTVKILKVPGNNNVVFTAKAEDKISLVERVEFYLDDELQSVDNESPYKWTYEGTEAHIVYAKAYNNAGLYKDSEKISTPRFITTNIFKFPIEILHKNILLKTNDANHFINETMIFILYGKIVYNGEEIHSGYKCWNFTPINVKLMGLCWVSDNGFFIRNEKVTQDPCYIAQTELIHGFVGKNYMVLGGFGFY